MPYAMGSKQNIQKPKQNNDVSCFGGDRAHASATFFHDFSVLGALWSTSGRTLVTLGCTLATLGCTLATLGRSLAALGAQSAPKGSSRDPVHLAIGCEVGAGNSVLEPPMLYETSRRSMGKGQMPYAIGPRPYAMGYKPHATKH